MRSIDYVLDRITMYRLVLYVLLALIGMATLLAYFHLLHFSPLALLLSTGLLVLMCWAMNTIFAAIFEIPANIESAFITALILALILDPAQSLNDIQVLGWAAILAMASKYLLALRKKHLFNPAAIAVVITAFTINGTASWWIGTASMLPMVLLGGWLIARKMRQEDIVILFCLAAVVCLALFTPTQGKAFYASFTQLLLQSPLFFFAGIMLTEPLTAPPTKTLRRVYAILTGVIFVPLVHIGPLYSTPELALTIGNLFAYIVSPKQKVLLTLQKKVKLAPMIVDFVFKPSQRLAFTPGQYMEFTLAHSAPDSRGNRRYFTLASSPTEDMLHLGVRFYETSSSFKRAMYWMDRRTPVIGAQIAGDFTLPVDPEQKLVFLAGGIGITPFRSMLKYLLDTQDRRDIALFYANATVHEIVYKDILSATAEQLGIKIWYTLTDLAAIPRNWTGLSGRIDVQMLMQAMPDYAERTYYISGPPEMVHACEHVLQQMQIKSSQIKKDFFPGLV